MKITHTDACSLRLLNPDSHELDIRACTGVGPNYKNKGSLRIGQGVGGYVAQTGISVTIPNLRKDDRIYYTSYLQDEGLMSLVSVPIKDTEGSVIGIISVYRREEYNFPDATVNLLSTYANNTAVAIKNARLFETITKNYSDTIQSLALALEAKDKYTRGHSERVTDFALQIAMEMDLSEDQINTLRFAGRLHDIGKIAISDNILLKNDKLTLAEYADIKTHPQRGADLLKPLAFLQETCEVIKHHHERFDGRGYPDGLKGEQIPLLSRILSIADAFDAMTSERPYRAPLSQEKALQETIDCADTQFDPDIVNIFHGIITKQYS
jgi:HD-GYP domain-containing protein (c-di-GMP phosphodiesterase class II)